MQFHIPVAEDKQAYERLCREISCLAYEYRFSFLWLWKDSGDFSICIEDDAAYLYSAKFKLFLAPITKDMHEALDRLYAYCKKTDKPCILTSVPQNVVDLIKDDPRYMIERSRELDDYVYTSEKLISLSGKKLQAKRNHISQFERDCSFTFNELTKNDFEECLALDDFWNSQHDASSEVRAERIALETAFRDWDMLGFIGAVIRVDGKVEAFTVGEIVDETEAIVHFEKGNTECHGIYPTINRLFCARFLSKVKYVDRQEDMGLESLRKAKMSYHPDLMVEKYTVERIC
ncbi:MAG: DUF2156 domain-containing protein [Sphaerochaetaceae bacterium]